jgi:RNA polymerase sigma-70 factor (sigma-E family)
MVVSDERDETPVEEAFTAFVGATGDRMLRLAILLTGDVAAGQDLLQSVYEDVYKRWRRHGRPDSPDSYLRTALSRAAGRARRWKASRPETLMEQPPDVASYEIGADLLLREHLLPALRRLPARQRQVVVLRYFADLTEAETAAAIGCAVGTVKAQAFRALNRLRDDPELARSLHGLEA